MCHTDIHIRLAILQVVKLVRFGQFDWNVTADVQQVQVYYKKANTFLYPTLCKCTLFPSVRAREKQSITQARQANTLVILVSYFESENVLSPGGKPTASNCSSLTSPLTQTDSSSVEVIYFSHCVSVCVFIQVTEGCWTS